MTTFEFVRLNWPDSRGIYETKVSTPIILALVVRNIADPVTEWLSEHLGPLQTVIGKIRIGIKAWISNYNYV